MKCRSIAAAAVLLSAVVQSSGLKGSWTGTWNEYQVTDSTGRVVLKSNDGVAMYADGSWQKLTKAVPSKVSGSDSVHGSYTGEQMLWAYGNISNALACVIKNYADGAVEFEVAYPAGLTGPFGSDMDSAVANFPAFDQSVFSFSEQIRSWQGTFIGFQEQASKGATGGPTVFFETDEAQQRVNYTIVASVVNNFKSSTAGAGTTYKGTTAWAPGTTSTVLSIPAGFSHRFVLVEGTGITETIGKWGEGMRARYRTKKVADVTLEKIGYQTDNGAYYVFCRGNCSETLIEVKQYYDSLDIPLGYLSFQGGGASSSDAETAPWCISQWGPDGGTGGNFPLPLKDFHAALGGIPMQYYAPYYCTTNIYFNKSDGSASQWKGVHSNKSLPGCGSYDFWDPEPAESYDFYTWLFKKGTDVGMMSFEPDFMNQNYRCMPAFIESVDAADIWQKGMNDAAIDQDLAVQWCMATPTDMMHALQLNAVTNFRVSTDFCYGHSWDIGSTSLLAWGLGVAPSKDTLWSTDNGRFSVPGCPWTPDHETPAAELHVVLALMSTGPLGISDAINMTNAELLKRTISADGTLLKPSKPITSVDSLVAKADYGPNGEVFGTYMGHQESDRALAYTYVAFNLKEKFVLPASDVYPAVGKGVQLYFRNVNAPCGTTLDSCLTKGAPVFPASDMSNTTGGTNYAPTTLTVYPVRAGQQSLILGELAKFVPLSPQRFLQVLDDAFTVRGAAGETVTVYAVNFTSQTVMKKHVVIPAIGMVAASFP